MFYVYIDEVLISSYKNFSEVQQYVLNYFVNNCSNKKELYSIVKDLTKLFDFVIIGLICHQYEYFKFNDHEVQIYYGS